LSIEACSGGSAIAGEATRGDGQPGEHLMQAGAHIGNGELDRGDHVAAGPEHRTATPQASVSHSYRLTATRVNRVTSNARRNRVTDVIV